MTIKSKLVVTPLDLPTIKLRNGHRVKLNLFTLALLVASAIGIMTPSTVCAQTLQTLYTFKGSPDGWDPTAGVSLDSKGDVYGTTQSGGSSTDCGSAGCGAIFELSAGKEKWIYSLKGPKTDGESPTNASVAINSKGNLYAATGYGGTGTCVNGGATGCGTIVTLTSSGTSEKIFHSFLGSPNDGWGPDGDMVFDSAGNLYGTTLAGGNNESGCSGGCGTVYKILSSGKESVFYKFCTATKCADGGAPQGGMVMDSSGNLYGTTSGGGAYLHGTVFKLSSSGMETVLHSFCAKTNCPDGEVPFGGLALNTATNILYGTTGAGGTVKCGQSSDGCGTLFEISTSGTNFKTLHDFGSAGDGIEPYGGLAIDKAGNVYGTTLVGGTDLPDGTVFEYTAGGTYSILWNFSGSDGGRPMGTLTLDSKGNLYGTTSVGGDLSCASDSSGCGTVFELTP